MKVMSVSSAALSVPRTLIKSQNLDVLKSKKQLELNYRPPMDPVVLSSLFWVFTGVFLRVLTGGFKGRNLFLIAQTHHGARDSTQSLWTRLSGRALGSNGSCFP